MSAHHGRRYRPVDDETGEYRRESDQFRFERGKVDHGAVVGTFGEVREADEVRLQARGASFDAGFDQVCCEERARFAG